MRSSVLSWRADGEPQSRRAPLGCRAAGGGVATRGGGSGVAGGGDAPIPRSSHAPLRLETGLPGEPAPPGDGANPCPGSPAPASRRNATGVTRTRRVTPARGLFHDELGSGEARSTVADPASRRIQNAQTLRRSRAAAVRGSAGCTGGRSAARRPTGCERQALRSSCRTQAEQDRRRGRRALCNECRPASLKSLKIHRARRDGQAPCRGGCSSSSTARVGRRMAANTACRRQRRGSAWARRRRCGVPVCPPRASARPRGRTAEHQQRRGFRGSARASVRVVAGRQDRARPQRARALGRRRRIGPRRARPMASVRDRACSARSGCAWRRRGRRRDRRRGVVTAAATGTLAAGASGLVATGVIGIVTGRSAGRMRFTGRIVFTGGSSDPTGGSDGGGVVGGGSDGRRGRRSRRNCSSTAS